MFFSVSFRNASSKRKGFLDGAMRAKKRMDLGVLVESSIEKRFVSTPTGISTVLRYRAVYECSEVQKSFVQKKAATVVSHDPA